MCGWKDFPHLIIIFFNISHERAENIEHLFYCIEIVESRDNIQAA